MGFIFAVVLFIAGVLIGFIFGILTVVIIRFSNEKMKIKKKYGFKQNIDCVNFGGDEDILNSRRDEQAAQEYL